MEPVCFGSLQFCAARVAALAANGEPLSGLHGYSTTATITASPSLVVEEGDDLKKKNGCGRVCQSFLGDDEITGSTVDLALCELDIQFAFLAAGGQLFSDLDSVPLGYQVSQVGDPAPNGVCLELWSKAWDGEEQATPEALGGEVAFWHWVFPKSKGRVADQTLEADFLEFSLSFKSTANGGMFPGGPFADWPDYISDGGGITSSFGLFLDTQIPTQTCDLETVPVGS